MAVQESFAELQADAERALNSFSVAPLSPDSDYKINTSKGKWGLGLLAVTTVLTGCGVPVAAAFSSDMHNIDGLGIQPRPTPDVPASNITRIFIVASPTPAETPRATATIKPTLEPSKTPEQKVATRTRIAVIASPDPVAGNKNVLPSPTTTPYQSDELFNDKVAQIILRPGELRILRYLQTEDHSKFCLKGADNGQIQVGVYNPETPVQFDSSKNRFINSISNGNLDKVVSKDQGCDQSANTGSGRYINEYWPVAFHNSWNAVKSFFFTIGERSLRCLGADEKLRVPEYLGGNFITWVAKKCG